MRIKSKKAIIVIIEVFLKYRCNTLVHVGTDDNCNIFVGNLILRLVLSLKKNVRLRWEYGGIYENDVLFLNRKRAFDESLGSGGGRKSLFFLVLFDVVVHYPKPPLYP